MPTVTIMPSIAAGAIAPVAPGASVPAQGGQTQGSPASKAFGAVMAAMAGARVDGTAQAVDPAALAVPARPAGTLIAANGDEAIDLTTGLPVVVEEQAAPPVDGTVEDHAVAAPEKELVQVVVADQPEQAQPGKAHAAPPAGHLAQVVATAQPVVAEAIGKPEFAEQGDGAELASTSADESDAAVPTVQPGPTLVPEVVSSSTVNAAQPAQEAAAEHLAQSHLVQPVVEQARPIEAPAAKKEAFSFADRDDGAPAGEALRATPALSAGAVADKAPLPGMEMAGHGSAPVPAAAFSQALAGLAAPVGTSPLASGVAVPVLPDQPVVAAQAGQIGHEMGVAIARGVDAGRETMFVRLDPAEMGRIHVRLSFDHDGAVRVAMSADSPVALDMLRREAGDLGRALNDAGVRSDSQSFRFDGGQSQQQGFAQQRGQGANGNGGGNQQQPEFLPGMPALASANGEASQPYRAVRSAGGLNVII